MTSANDPLMKRRYSLLFGVRKSVRYHDHRRRFYLTAQSWVHFIGIVLGSAAAAQFLTGEAWAWSQWLFPGVIAVTSAYALVVRIGDKAAIHLDLYRRFIRLERSFLGAPIDEETLDQLEDKRLEIEMDEPPIFQALNRACHNEILQSEGRNHLMKPLSLHHRFLKGFFRFEQLPFREDRSRAA